MKVTQVTIGRFSQFHLARQLEKHDLLDTIWTAYPKFKLGGEKGIPQEKIKTFPWIYTPYMYMSNIGMRNLKWLSREWNWLAHESLDNYVSTKLKNPTIVIGLSGSGLKSGTIAQKNGGKYICHRGSSHIGFQNDILKEEYKRWGIEFSGVDTRKIAKEEEEYDISNAIVVPSEFARQTFIDKGVAPQKVVKLAYGASLDRFRKTTEPAADSFHILWVGAVSIRKGFMDALHAFQQFQHPRKKFTVVGSLHKEVEFLLKKENLENVVFKGTIPNNELLNYYSASHAFLLPSIEEGLANVQGEALACGCPVIATRNAGAEDLFTDGVEGYIVPMHSPSSIANHLEMLAQDRVLRETMSNAAIMKIKAKSGWDSYGNEYANLIRTGLY